MKNLRDSRLKLLFDSEQLEGTKPDGLLVSAFWSPHPILPVITKDTTHLYDWGNRDKHLRLPLTGWTKIESLSDGRWNWLKPMPAIIPALAGYENGVWFKIDGGIRGIVVTLNGQHRAYMLTKAATDAYTKTTDHDRMPVFVKGDEAFSETIKTGKLLPPPDYKFS